MSKLGFMQDLIRGIKKIIGEESHQAVVKETVVTKETNTNYEPLLERAFMFLEDGNWTDADAYCEKVLDLNPKCAEAYLGKLMAELRVRRKEKLADCADPFDGKNNYQKILRFGSDELISTLGGYIKHINERNELARLERIYSTALKNMQEAKFESSFKQAAKDFQGISNYKDSAELAKKCLEKAEIARKDKIYDEAKSQMNGNTVYDYECSIKTFKRILDWKDSAEQIAICEKSIKDLEQKYEQQKLAKKKEAEEKERKEKDAKLAAKRKTKKVFMAIVSVTCVCVVFLVLMKTVIMPKQKYNQAMKLISSDDYDSAYALLEEIGDNETIISNKYDRAIKYIDSGDYDSAYVLLEEIGDNETIVSNKYDRAIKYIDSGNYKGACMLLDGLSYKDSAEKFLNSEAKYEQSIIKNATVGDIVNFGTYEQDNNTTNGKEDIEWLVLAKKGNKVLVISRYTLDCKQYNTLSTDVTWETCSLREWLNNDFINTAFTDNEKAMIPTITVSADKNPRYDTNPGNTTKDKVFLLSIVEAKKYFSSDEARKCIPTAYTKANGVYTIGEYTVISNPDRWWLRSPGDSLNDTACITSDGFIANYGSTVSDVHIAVRPAMWISIE